MKHFSLAVLIVVGFGVVQLIPNLDSSIPNAEATLNYFGVQISNTCYRQLQYNLITVCPSYESIMAIIPDTSDRDRSGDFIIKDNIFQRGRPQLEDHLEFYRFENRTILFIDPPGDIQSQLNMIFIEAQLHNYPIKKQTVTNNTLYMGDLRYIDSCRIATIDAGSWLWLLGDTIHYMQNNCQSNFTSANSTVAIYINKTKHDIATSNKFLHEAFIDYVKENCIFVYGSC